MERVRKRILGPPFSVHGGRLCADQHAGNCDACASFERELYSLFGNKQAMLVACIAERAQRLKARPISPRCATGKHWRKC